MSGLEVETWGPSVQTFVKHYDLWQKSRKWVWLAKYKYEGQGQEHTNILKVTLPQKGMVSKKGTKARNKGL